MVPDRQKSRTYIVRQSRHQKVFLRYDPQNFFRIKDETGSKIDPEWLLTARQKSTRKIAREEQIEKRDADREASDLYNNLIIRARRRIQEETLDLGDRLRIYCHRINK